MGRRSEWRRTQRWICRLWPGETTKEEQVIHQLSPVFCSNTHVRARTLTHTHIRTHARTHIHTYTHKQTNTNRGTQKYVQQDIPSSYIKHINYFLPNTAGSSSLLLERILDRGTTSDPLLTDPEFVPPRLVLPKTLSLGLYCCCQMGLE